MHGVTPPCALAPAVSATVRGRFRFSGCVGAVGLEMHTQELAQDVCIREGCTGESACRERVTVTATAPSTAPVCPGCGGLLSREDVVLQAGIAVTPQG